MAETDGGNQLSSGNNNQKVIRAPSLKRGKEETRLSHREVSGLEQHLKYSVLNENEMGITPGAKVQVREKEYVLAYDVKLERVLGLTVSTNSGLDCDSNSQLIAYPAGCAVVLFNPVKRRQSHLLNTSRKTVTCVSFSPDGKYLATGECGHVPSVRVWDLNESSQIAEFPGHKYGINCLAFSPSQKYVVSVGSQHDMIVNVWDWKSGVKIASNKVSTKVKAISFAENGNYFVTVGNRHVKFWYLEYSRSAKYKEPVPLMGRSAILGEQRNNDFCDVACGKGTTGGSTYAVTRSGLLCEFNNRRLLDKWVELRTTSANCMAVGEGLIFIGCAEGIVRCFSPLTLQFITTLPRTHYLGVDVAQGLNISHMASHPKNAKYPDAIALAFDEINGKLTCVYNDHSLYVWDVRDIKRVGKAHSFLYHSACIWGVEMYPDNSENKSIPSGSFLTCSSDDTIRVWNLDFTESEENNSLYRRNIYSNELLKVIYVDPEYTYLKDIDITGAEKGDNASYDSRNGVRSIRISPDGNHLASGDRSGNIRIHDIHTLAEQCLIEAHDAEVLCLEYSSFENNERNLLASASRDRLIHIFNVNEEYNFVQTLDDHSSSITSVRFLNSNGQQQMVSCGADKSIIFRHLQGDQFTRGHNAAGKTTLYDMEVDFTQKHVLTACQDRNIRVYSVNSGKHTKTFKGSVGEDGSLIKITLDASGILVATSCTDKTLCIYDYYSGECLATMLGHSELATGLRFTNDCTRLISASGDGCIFVWKVPHDLVVTMHARLSQQAARAGKKLNGIGLYSSDNEIYGRSPIEMLDPNANAVTDNDYRFNVGQLPLWAKKQISERDVSSNEGPRTLERPKGRWAQRLDPSGITVKSVYETDTIIPFSSSKDKRLDSDGSKEDSSIDSGTETSRSLFHQEIRRETMVTAKQITDSSKTTLTRGVDMHQQRSRHLTDDSSLGSFKYEDIESTEHDGDVEDCSEGESTEAEPRHQLIYYPPTEDSHSDYTVNAMDVEELRKSQRRTKRLDLLLVPGETSQSVSGSQESEDDEQASTPSGENSERNIITMLSASSESLDVISSREIFFKNTFESLSGAEVEKDPSPKAGKRSISSQHLGNGPRNSTVIQAAKHAKNDVETSKKRKELQRRIEETRRQLNSVGYRSNLKTSQSIQDLSPRGKGFHDSKPQKQGHLPSNVRLQASNLGKDIDSKTCIKTNKLYATNTTNENPKRPYTLNFSTDQCRIYCKANCATNMSLPESPVYDESSLSKCLTDSEVGKNDSSSQTKQLSYSFFVDLKSSYYSDRKETCKSLESLSEIGQSVDISIDEEKSDISAFSSDSLESCDFSSSKPPRRCVSEYQIYEEKISGEKTRFHSEENILGDCIDSFGGNKSGMIDRHSSASFFLRRKDTCCSTESILTDESEYQYLFTNQEKEEFRSTESMLTDGSDSVSKDYPEKRTVFRTRSLQDATHVKVEEMTSNSRPETPYECPEDTKPKNECFFIPLGRNNMKSLPDVLLKKFRKEEAKRKLETDVHPVVTHKPPKPQQKSNKTQHKHSQKIHLNSVPRRSGSVRNTVSVWKKDIDLRRVWEMDVPVKNPELNSVIENVHEIKETKLSNSLNLETEKNDVIICKELEPIEFVVKEVIIDKIISPSKKVLNSSVVVSEIVEIVTKDRSDIGTALLKSKNDNDFKHKEIKQDVYSFGQTDNGKFRPRMPNVKLLSQNFERISLRSLPDEGILSGEDMSCLGPFGYDSGSSTPATSSSCTNSPKRLTNHLTRNLKNNMVLPSKCNTVNEETTAGGIRRACSLSDLATPASLNKQHQLHANHLQASKSVNRSGTRTVSRHTVSKPTTLMTRSSSVGVLNQSDSESDLSHQHSGSSVRTTRVMRPTISSQNKAISAVNKMAPLPARRRGMSNAYSSMALNQAGDNEDSSSEEGKNNPVGRQRSASQDRSNAMIMGLPHRRAGTGLGRSGSERDLAHSQRMSQRPGVKIQRSSSGLIRTVSNLDPNAADFQAKDNGNLVDVASAPLSQQLIASITEQLMRATDSVVQLHKRLAVEPVNQSDRDVLLTDLQGAIGEAQKTLRLVEPTSDPSVANKIQDALTTSNESGGTVVSALQQYSDILVSLVQQRMSNESKK